MIRKRFVANSYIDSRIKAALAKPSEEDKNLTDEIIIDAETKLPAGMGFNWYIQNEKGRANKNFSLRYVEIITELINKFKLKS